MIAPEPDEGINQQTSLPILLRNNLLASALIFLVLEIWRPRFFLTDDNLDAGYPFFMGVGRHLLKGESPFFTSYLYGGHYDFLRDPTYFLWHPFYLLTSLLAGTPLHTWIIDVDAFAFFMLTTAGFVALAHYLRREMSLKIGDGWIMFYTLSFTYSVFALTTGASWLNFAANQSALPWLALGILQKTWRRGLGLVTLFSLHQLMAGHPEPDISNTAFLTLFALGVSLCRRSALPLAFWMIGYAIAVLLLLPMALPMVEGFFASPRAEGVPIADMQDNNIPLRFFPTSLFIGMALWIIHPPQGAHITYMLALGSCAAAWCLIPALASRSSWRPLDRVVAVLMLFGVVMVCRPVWIAQIMSHLPVLKSMRWPFRELMQFLFFFHLFLLLRSPGFTVRVQRLIACLSLCAMAFPLFFYIIPPSFNAMPLGRQLIFSGEFDRYWDQVRALLKPNDRIAVLIPYDFYVDDHYEKPYGLLGTFDYAILARVINVSGYSHTVPRDELYTATAPYFPNGAYEISQKAALMKEKPELKFITLESLRPLKITLSSRDGPTIDLTPHVPTRWNIP